MTIPRITESQKRAIRNLMFSAQNIDLVLTYMTGHGKKYIGELSIGEARDLISSLVGDSR